MGWLDKLKFWGNSESEDSRKQREIEIIESLKSVLAQENKENDRAIHVLGQIERSVNAGDWAGAERRVINFMAELLRRNKVIKLEKVIWKQLKTSLFKDIKKHLKN